MSETPISEYWIVGWFVVVPLAVVAITARALIENPELVVHTAMIIGAILVMLIVPTAVGYVVDWWLFDE